MYSLIRTSVVVSALYAPCVSATQPSKESQAKVDTNTKTEKKVYKRPSIDEVVERVHEDDMQNFRISPMFEEYEADDDKVIKKVKSDKNLLAFVQKDMKSQKGVFDLDDSSKPANPMDAISRYMRDFEVNRPSYRSSSSNSFKSSSSSSNSINFANEISEPESIGAQSGEIRQFTGNPNGGANGGVISIPLDSQLQIQQKAHRSTSELSMSFLQTRKNDVTTGGPSVTTAADHKKKLNEKESSVEKEVSRERKWNLSLSEGFLAQEQKDKEIEKTIRYHQAD